MVRANKAISHPYHGDHSSHLVWDGDTEAFKPPFWCPKGIEEPSKVVHQEGDVDSIESDVLEGRVMDEGAAAVADGTPDDSKDLGRLDGSRDRVRSGMWYA